MTTRPILAILGALLLGGAAANAQGSDSLPNVASLRAPATPAFVLLGVSPSDVSRPQTPGDLALSFVNAASSATRLPEDLAREVCPYWLLPHARNPWQSDTTRSIAGSLARTFAVSVATAKSEDDAAPSTGLGIGVRAM